MPPGAEGETENGGTEDEETTETEGDDEEEEQSGGSFNAVAHIDQLVGERGGGEKAAKALARKFFWENRKLRGKLRSARKRAVGEKDLVLKGDEATAVKKLLALGKPDDIEKKLGESDSLRKKVQDSERETFLAEIADRLGFTSRKGKKAFLRAAKSEGIDIQDREQMVEDDDGKKKKMLVPMAKLLTEGDDKFRPIEEFVEEDLGEFLPAFQAEDDDEESSTPESREAVPRDTPTRRITPMVSQSRSTTSKSGKRPERAAVSGALNQRYKLPEKKK